MKSFRTSLLATIIVLICASVPSAAQQNFWQPLNGPEGADNDITAMATGPSGAIFAADRLRLHRSTDAGVTWEPIQWPDSLFHGPFESLAVLRNGSPNGIVFARLRDYIYRSTDNGLTWLGQPVVVNNGDRHSVIAAPDGYVYTTGHLVNSGGTLIRSTNGGVSWVPAAFFPADDPILAVDSIGGIAMYDGLGTVFFSSNNGVRWTVVKNEFPVTALAFTRDRALLMTTATALYRARLVDIETWRVDSVSALPIASPPVLSYGRGGVIYVAGNGVYRSLDNGGSWIDVSSGLRVPTVLSFAQLPEGWVYAGTDGGSVARSSVKDSALGVTRVPADRSGIAGVRLSAFPNPLADRAVLELSLDAQAAVRVDLVSADGAILALLLDEAVLSAGTHSIAIDASTLPAGRCFCRVTIDGRIEVVPLEVRR